MKGKQDVYINITKVMKKAIKFNYNQGYCVLLFVLYLCRIVINIFEIKVPLFALVIYYFITILMGILIVITAIHRLDKFPKEFFLMVACVITFFEITCRLHPEYEKYIIDEFWTKVISLDGIFGYFIIRIVQDEELLEKGLKIAAPILFIAFFLQSLGAISRGYWYIFYQGKVVRSNYNMGFGYNMLVPSLIFLYFGMKERRSLYLAASIVGLLEIIMLGSRAAILGIPAMVFLYIIFCEHNLNNKNKLIIIIFMLAFGITTMLFFRQILYFLDSAFKLLGISSRTIQRMIEGSISEDNVRNDMYSQVISLIKNNFWGCGMLSDRYYFGQYCHNIIFEILLQFGWIFGTILLVVFSMLTIKILTAKNDEIKGIFVLFFCMSFFRLLVSHSFWINQYFWCAIGLAVSYSMSVKNKRKFIRVKLGGKYR